MRWRARVGDRHHEVDLTRDDAGHVEASVDGRRYSLSVTEPQSQVYSLIVDGMSHEAIVRRRAGVTRVRIGAAVFEVVSEEPSRAASSRATDGVVTITAVMPGRVLRVLVSEGDTVDERQGLVVLEAMKMENELSAPRGGVIRSVKVSPGATVETGDALIVLQ